MKKIIVDSYDDMSKLAADRIIEVVKANPKAVLGLATGSTPLGTYKYLIKAKQEGVDFSQITTFNLDEYLGIDLNHPQCYHRIMRDELLDELELDPARSFFPEPGSDGVFEYGAYEKAIEAAGGIDLQLLGIGNNGHIAFNEPGTSLNVYTEVVDLTPSTIHANARFFECESDVPTQAISMGMGTIMAARELIVIANGPAKQDPVAMLLDGYNVTPLCPVTFTLLHPNSMLIVDKKAAGIRD